MSKTTILIVEDEPAIADAIGYALEMEGFQTRCLHAGAEAVALLESGAFALAILDIGLPDINGIELCKRLRQRCAVPIIFLTARDSEIDRIVGLEVGGDDYVSKPFSPRELTARVKAVLRRTQPPPRPAPGHPLFTLDAERCQARFCEQLLELSRYEFLLLQVFLRRPGQVFSREQLMELVWDAPEASMDRTVDAHIKNLRAKLRAIDGTLDPIVTHRGLGYSLKEDA
ncbi:MAG: two-component system response regulator CreB [Desulfuromonadales bacterium GWD2_61_12]|nr:MAG: two-component system response regulator CreB [Desulfuromonadales bacterium GWD2_61_12]HBT82226.1 two-component system response regulator CreB [Desulfuromonas sp.]